MPKPQNLITVNNFLDEREDIDITSEKYSKVMFLYN